MTSTYVHHRITTEPLQWQAVAEALSQTGAQRLEAAGGALYGIWRSQIGRPRDELTVMTLWPDPGHAANAAEILLQGVEAIRDCHNQPMQPTVRPQTPEPPRRQGNYAFRWFDTRRQTGRNFSICAWQLGRALSPPTTHR